MIPDKNVVTQSITLLIDLLKFDALLNLLIFFVNPTQPAVEVSINLFNFGKKNNVASCDK